MNLSVQVGLAREGFELDVSMQLDAEVTALFGPSGCGKTTLLHAIAGLLRPRRGRIALGAETWFDAESRTFAPPRERRVGLLFQDLRLFPHLDAEANLLFGYRQLPAARRRLVPQDVIERLELGSLLRHRPDHLSGGERQRVALGRTLLAMPRLLLMDEPLAALDLRLRRQILPYLRWVHESLSIPLLYVSHSLSEVLELTDQVVVLDRVEGRAGAPGQAPGQAVGNAVGKAVGRVVGQGEVFEVLGRTLQGSGDPVPAGSFATASLLPAVVLAAGEDSGSVRGTVGGQQVVLPATDLAPGSSGRVALRPEDVMLAENRLAQVSARNQLRGTVERISPLHGRHLVHLRVGPDAVLRAELTGSAMEDLGVEVGRSFYCVVKTSAFQWQ